MSDWKLVLLNYKVIKFINLKFMVILKKNLITAKIYNLPELSVVSMVGALTCRKGLSGQSIVELPTTVSVISIQIPLVTERQASFEVDNSRETIPSLYFVPPLGKPEKDCVLWSKWF